MARKAYNEKKREKNSRPKSLELCNFNLTKKKEL